jgi:hypothetical protein
VAARFHRVTALAMDVTLSAANIWSAWSGDGDQATTRFFAAAVPTAYWAPFFLAPLVPGTTVDGPPHPVGRVARVPVNLLGRRLQRRRCSWLVRGRLPFASWRPRAGGGDVRPGVAELGVDPAQVGRVLGGQVVPGRGDRAVRLVRG